MIRPTDGRLLYSNTFEDLLREYHCDECSYSGTYPSEVLANDPVVMSPCSSASDRMMAFRVSPDGVVLQRCSQSRNLWRDADGAVIYDESSGTLISLGSSGWVLTQSSVVNLETLAKVTIAGLPARSWIDTRWNAPDGFYVAVAGLTVSAAPELWRVSTSGGATLIGTYGPLPANTASPIHARLDGSGRLFAMARDTTQSFVDVIIRREVGKASDVVYTEANNPLVKLHISGLVTGP